MADKKKPSSSKDHPDEKTEKKADKPKIKLPELFTVEEIAVYRSALMRLKGSKTKDPRQKQHDENLSAQLVSVLPLRLPSIRHARAVMTNIVDHVDNGNMTLAQLVSNLHLTLGKAKTEAHLLNCFLPENHKIPVPDSPPPKEPHLDRPTEVVKKPNRKDRRKGKQKSPKRTSQKQVKPTTADEGPQRVARDADGNELLFRRLTAADEDPGASDDSDDVLNILSEESPETVSSSFSGEDVVRPTTEELERAAKKEKNKKKRDKKKKAKQAKAEQKND